MTTCVGSWSVGDDPSRLIPLLVVAAAPMMGLNPVEFEQRF